MDNKKVSEFNQYVQLLFGVVEVSWLIGGDSLVDEDYDVAEGGEDVGDTLDVGANAAREGSEMAAHREEQVRI